MCPTGSWATSGTSSSARVSARRSTTRASCAPRASPGFAFSHPAHAIALGLGAGLSPYAPGTVGTLVAWPIGWYAATAMPPALLAAVIAPLFALGVWACARTGRDLGVADHRAMV